MKRRRSVAYVSTPFKAPPQKKARTYAPPAKFVKGKDRTSGYYGRYQGRDREKKFFDTTISFNVDATGEVPTTGQLNLIAQGVTEKTRVGRKATIKNIYIKGVLVFTPGAAANAADVSHMYIILDTQCNGAAASATDVFEGTNLSNNYRNLANQTRFRILKHFIHTWNPTAGVSGAYNQQIKNFKYGKKCNIPIEFDSTTGAIGEIKSNNLFLLAGTAGQTDDLIAVSGKCRLRFDD